MSALGAKIVAARAVGELARRAGRGGGTSLPGKVLIRLEPHAIAELSARLRRGCAVISATNGKTTTASMAASILQCAGVPLVHNRAGANMAGGVASTLLSAARAEGRSTASSACSRWTSSGSTSSRQSSSPERCCSATCSGISSTATANWTRSPIGGPPSTRSLPGGTRLALNADDPLIADLGRGIDGVTYFGVEDPSVAMPEMQHAADSKHCRRCGAAYVYDAIYLGHLGRYRCPSCGAERPVPAVAAEGIVLDGTRGARFRLRTPGRSAEIDLPLPGLYNIYNALGAAALCLDLGASVEQIRAGLEAVTAAFGRAETVADRRCRAPDPARQEPGRRQ